MPTKTVAKTMGAIALTVLVSCGTVYLIRCGDTGKLSWAEQRKEYAKQENQENYRKKRENILIKLADRDGVPGLSIQERADAQFRMGNTNQVNYLFTCTENRFTLEQIERTIRIYELLGRIQK